MAGDTSGWEKVLETLLRRAEEELRLIHMKDCGAIYDVGLRAEMSAALSTQEPALRGGKVEEIAEEIASVARRYRTHEVPLSSRKVADVFDDFAAALRTHAGESAAQSERARLEAEIQEIQTDLDEHPSTRAVGGYRERRLYHLLRELSDLESADLSAARKAGGE